MSVTPSFDVTGSRLLAVVDERLEALVALAGVTTTGADLQAQYLKWVSRTAELLRGKIGATDLETLVASQSAWRVASISPDPWNRDVLLATARFEVDSHVERFTVARDRLHAEVTRWTTIPGRLVIPDSSLFLNHPDKLEQMVLADDLQERGVPLRLVLPIVVVDELDALKQAGAQHVRWRAGYTLAVLDRVLRDGVGPARLRAADYSGIDDGAIPRGEVTVEVLLDPPEHRRLPINDDEIVDRAVAVQRLAGRDVTVVTYDTGQSTRARAAGLAVVKLHKLRYTEPRTV